MAVVAIIPARGGSKGIPGKNLREVDGRSLVVRSVDAALASRRIDITCVSSDDRAILDSAAARGARAIIRPSSISSDVASSESAVLHALEVLAEDGIVPELVVMIQCTSPFTTGEDLDRLVGALEDDRFQAAMLVSPDHGFLWGVDGDGRGVGINHDESQPRRRRQDLPPQFRETGAGYAMREPAFRATKTRFCGSVALVVSPTFAVDIDTPLDLAVADSVAHIVQSAKPLVDLASITALVMDFDGVHTDDAVFVDQEGRESVRCSRADGLGIERIRNVVECLILSKETNPVVTRRAEKLRIEVIQGADDKISVLRTWAAQKGVSLEQVGFVGNDVNDVACLLAVGVSFAPADAHPEAKRAARHILTRTGGNGAIREVCDLVFAAKSTQRT